MVKVGLAQFASGTSVSDNLRKVEQLCAEAENRNVEILMLPEYSMYCNAENFGEGFSSNAEPIPNGAFVTRLSELARTHGLYIVAGLLETSPATDDRVFNTVVVINAEGELLVKYRKVHLYDAYGGVESTYLLHGDPDQLPTFTYGDMRFGVATCYDIRFPEYMRRFLPDSVDAFVLPAVWTPGVLKGMHWDVLTKARAIENIVYLAAVNAPAPVSTGLTRVVSPDGTVLGELGGHEGLLTVDLDLEAVRAERSRNTSLRNVRYPMIGETQ